MSEIVIPMQKLIWVGANILIQRRSKIDDTMEIIEHHVKIHEPAGLHQIPALLHRTGKVPVVLRNVEELSSDSSYGKQYFRDKLKELLEWKDRPFAVILIANEKVLDAIADRCYVFMRNVEEMDPPKSADHQIIVESITQGRQIVEAPKPPTKQELIDCIANLMGVFDTPIARRKIDGDYAEEARKIGREIMERTGRKP